MIEFAGVDKSYGAAKALDGFDLTVPEGAVLGLIGPNGAGKTTTMLVMSTLLERDGGHVRVAGLDPAVDAAGVRRMLGYMPDFFGFYESLTSVEYLDFFGASQKIPAAKRPGLISDLLELVDLTGKANADVNSLSRGMKQRLSLARALLHDPQLLILDEPASGLDPRARVQLRELIAELARLGKTVVISSHILTELEGICSHMAIVDGGKAVAQGPLDEMRTLLTANFAIAARVPDASVDTAVDHLTARTDVSDVTVERGMVRFVMSGDDSVSAVILRELIEAGVAVSEWRVESAGLEELFMQLTDGGGE
ncbi:MAG: ABC transporter ATP-binding protein [Acidimicrobiia bacterium]